MARSFYHYLMTYRDPKKTDAITEFAYAAYNDHSFPKQTKDYHELSSYLELNTHYLQGMALFDELYEKYLQDEEKNN